MLQSSLTSFSASKKIDGKIFSSYIHNSICSAIECPRFLFSPPHLRVFSVGDDFASHLYISKKHDLCKKYKIGFSHNNYPVTTTTAQLSEEINKANEDSKVSGIILQLPIPKHLDRTALLASIKPTKDVDCLNPQNVCSLVDKHWGTVVLPPCATAAIMLLELALQYGNNPQKYFENVDPITKTSFDFKGENAVVVGYGLTAGMPISLMLTKANANVTVVDKNTENAKEIIYNSPIVFSCVGKKHILGEVNENSVVIDVGIDMKDNKIVGDFNSEAYSQKTKNFSPVPGGVGKVTVAMLVVNLIKCWQ